MLQCFSNEFIEVVLDGIQILDIMNEEFEEPSEEEFLIIKDNFINYLGEGGGRKAYSFKNNFVIKLPKTEDGELQCEIENKISLKENLSILCKSLYNYSDDTIIQEKLTMIKEDYETIYEYLKATNPNLLDNFKNQINYLINEYDLIEEDLIKISSWGLSQNGKILLFDYGCTMDIWEEFYM